jgi:predicted CXXCH cytochrome family protein
MRDQSDMRSTRACRVPPARPRLGRASAIVAASLVAAAVSGFAAQVRPTGSTETCVSVACHPKIVTHKVMHGPVAQQKCMACHVYDDPEAHRFSLAEPSGRLCTTCHVFQTRTYAHEPVRQGNCTGCHDPHGSEHRMMLVADPVRGLCVSCHRESESAKFVHGPVAAGACILCHDAHSSWEPKLLTEPARDLCLGCHEEMTPYLDDQRYPHPPVAEDCLICHDAHASEHRFQLHADAPGLCLDCHDEVRTEIEAAPVVHGATLGEGGCTACHDAHGGQLPAMQRAGQTALCLDCHDGSLTTASGRRLTDMAGLLRDNPQHHGPIREGACSACHEPHAAEHRRLLRKAYPPEFYAPFERERYELCFECHISQLVESEHGTGLTRFRDGDRNLHWLHVNRQKGRTCRACHEVHASKNPFHIRDTVPFGKGGWELEIGYRQTATGGACAPGCHKPVEYNRGKDQAAPPALKGGQ